MTKDRYDFSQADEFVKFGEDNGMYIIGHCLVWHSQLAPWFLSLIHISMLATPATAFKEAGATNSKNSFHIGAR